jgi:Ca2+-binding RTX toxin-like protein
LDGTVNAEEIDGLGGKDTLNGFDGNDILIGDDPKSNKFDNDFLNGGVGNDVMQGGRGDDTYIVDSVGDGVVETLNEGFDTIKSTVSFTLPANVEKLILDGTGSINGTGNSLDNTIIGNSANNALTGGAGNDTLEGHLGSDTLDGGSGTNVLKGGENNDVYVIHSGSTNTITDTSGVDTVRSFVTFTLGAGIENLELQGSAAINGTGNTLNNIITGNSKNNKLDGDAGDDILNGLGGKDTLIGGTGNDVLDGGTGNDLMEGGLGNDFYKVDSSGDQVNEVTNGGIDTVLSSANSFTLPGGAVGEVENLLLVENAVNGTGNAENNLITGNDLANTLKGQTGNDTLSGGAGDDLLIGGKDNDRLVGGAGSNTMEGDAGNDTFVFDTNHFLTPTNPDVIKDFNRADDTIELSKAIFGPITTADIAIVANDSVAATSTALITYDSATGNLFFNQNGAAAGFGTGGQFATLSSAPSITAANFQIV